MFGMERFVSLHYSRPDCRRNYEYLDHPIRCLVDRLDYRVLRVSRGGRPDPPVARAGRYLADHPLCRRSKDGLSSEIERVFAAPAGLEFASRIISRARGGPLYSNP